MLSFDILIAGSLTYVIFLFAVAFWAERASSLGRLTWLKSPAIYTLSLSIYCTAWTFYGAVGFAARSGLEFLTIYLGPTLILIGWWLLLRRMVRIGKNERITSIADLISSRFGKSVFIGAIVTVLAVFGTTPYIALQLQSVTLSLSVFQLGAETDAGSGQIAFWIAIGLTVFTVLFGTRNLDVDERHTGVVVAIAIEAIVKLVALLAVGIFVVWGIAGGIEQVIDRIDASNIPNWRVVPSRWIGLIFLSAAAFLCLPRMFHVMVVENTNESHLATASWAFPLYLMAMSLFVVPIAVVGLDLLPHENPDLFVVTLPLSQGQNALAVLAFLGGFSSATSMVIVASIALSTMISNHIVTPIWFRLIKQDRAVVAGDVRALILNARRISIAVILGLGYLYYRLSGGGTALAAIGLVSFVGVAQVLPSLIGGLFWKNATKTGAAAGLITGFVFWGFTIFLPSVGANSVFWVGVVENGLGGMDFLRPHALFGISGLDPVVHSVFWSISFNSCAFVLGSIFSKSTPMERYQSIQFLNLFDQTSSTQSWTRSQADAEDLLMMTQRILGASHAQAVFREAATIQGKDGYLPDPTPEFVSSLERALSGSVGGATAHAMIGQMVNSSAVSVQDLIAAADEAAQIMEYSHQLEEKSQELSNAAQRLREANAKLVQVSEQKDAFLSQVSHELRTPMTSIRSFSEILKEVDIDAETRSKYAKVIHNEAQRLTRLLDDLLDLSVLENGSVRLEIQTLPLSQTLTQAIDVYGATLSLEIQQKSTAENVIISTDHDRLLQVFVNVIANVEKYCDASHKVLKIMCHTPKDNNVTIDFIDNGSGVAKSEQNLIFEKFSRISDQAKAGGAGLGLAICREIMTSLGGTISYLPGQRGAAFRIVVPLVFNPDLKN